MNPLSGEGHLTQDDLVTLESPGATLHELEAQGGATTLQRVCIDSKILRGSL